MTIDRYILRQFLINFVILLAVLIGLIVVIDLVVNLDEFLKRAREVEAERGGGTAGGATVLAVALHLIWDWYAPLSVLIYVYLSGLLVVGAMGFTFSEMSRKRELTAVVASGVSMYRLAAPILLAGALLNGIALPIQEYVIPPLASKLARSHDQVGEPGISSFSVRFAPDGRGNILSAARFDATGRVLSDVVIFDRDEQGALLSTLMGAEARWDEQRQGWDISDGRVIDAATDDKVAQLQPDPAGHLFFETPLSPQVLLARRASLYTHFLGLAELRQLSQSEAADAAQIQRIMHQRFSMLVVNMLVLLMGLPYFLNREPTNPMGQAVRAAAVCLGAWAAGLTVLQVSGGQLNPLAAAWLPVVIYLPVSVWLLQRVKT